MEKKCEVMKNEITNENVFAFLPLISSHKKMKNE
jgi:hypothetical protein